MSSKVTATMMIQVHPGWIHTQQWTAWIHTTHMHLADAVQRLHQIRKFVRC